MYSYGERSTPSPVAPAGGSTYRGAALQLPIWPIVSSYGCTYLYRFLIVCVVRPLPPVRSRYYLSPKELVESTGLHTSTSLERDGRDGVSQSLLSRPRLLIAPSHKMSRLPAVTSEPAPMRACRPRLLATRSMMIPSG